jgi:hypothetical protein
MTPEAELIIRLYNRMIPLVIERGSRTSMLSMVDGKVIRHAEDLHRWLEARSITPGAYLASCFAKHSWAYKPKFSRLPLPVYEKYFEANRDDAYLWWAAIRCEFEADQPVELPVGKEIIKKRILTEIGPERCAVLPGLTGGYNAKSLLCRRCRMSEACKADE